MGGERRSSPYHASASMRSATVVDRQPIPLGLKLRQRRLGHGRSSRWQDTGAEGEHAINQIQSPDWAYFTYTRCKGRNGLIRTLAGQMLAKRLFPCHRATPDHLTSRCCRTSRSVAR